MPLCYLQPCHALGRTGPPALHWCSRRMEECGCLADMCRSTLSIHVSDLTPSSLIETVIQLFKLHARTKTVVTRVHHTVLRLRNSPEKRAASSAAAGAGALRSAVRSKPGVSGGTERRCRFNPAGKRFTGSCSNLLDAAGQQRRKAPKTSSRRTKACLAPFFGVATEKLLVTRKRTVYIQGFRQLEIESILPA